VSRIVFINRVYWPSTEATAQILRDLTLGLAASGTSVLVITGTPLSDQEKDDCPNLTVHRLGTGNRRTLGILSKLRDYSRFTQSAKITVSQVVKPTDTVVAMTDPPMLGSDLGPTVRKAGGAMWHWSQDLYPEVALAIRPFGPLTIGLKLLLPRRNREWHQCTGIVAIGADMAEKIGSQGISEAKISVSQNWAPSGLAPTKHVYAETSPEAKPPSFILSYSGNLGRAHVLEPVLDLVKLLQAHPTIETRIIGNGPQKRSLVERVNRENLTRCVFLAPVPISELQASLAGAHLHLITMRPDCVGTVWPSKFYGIVAVARPMIFIGPQSAEIAQLITKHDLGISVEPDDLKEASRFVERLAGDQNVHHEYCARVAAFGKIQPGLDGAVTFWNRIVGQSHLESDPV
jgi:colanic acid biosynthesis glycosyl transferase WcaI